MLCIYLLHVAYDDDVHKILEECIEGDPQIHSFARVAHTFLCKYILTLL